MFTFRPQTIPSNIFVVGCGGTGSRLIPTLVQFIRSITKQFNPRGWLGSTNIIFIDGDVVEEKNLLRQNFIAADVGKNKAAVLANRYGKAYGMPITTYPKFIEPDTDPFAFRRMLNEATGLNLGDNYNDMVIMCVDSAEARRTVIKALTGVYGNPTVFIDAGNEDSFGQVRMFHNHVLVGDYDGTEEKLRAEFKKVERIEYTPEPMSFIPFDVKFYQEMQDMPGQGSCADLDQTLAINSLMATLIMSFVQNHYYNKVIDYHAVSIDIVRGSTGYSKNTLTAYRNMTVVGSDTGLVGGGGAYLAGHCQSSSGPHIFKSFIAHNDKAIADLLKAQENPVVTEVVEEPKKKVAKKKVKELKAVIQPTLMEVELAPVQFNTTIRGVDAATGAEEVAFVEALTPGAGVEADPEF